MDKLKSFIGAGCILGGTVILSAAISPFFLEDHSLKPLTKSEAATIAAQALKTKCADCHTAGAQVNALADTLSGGMLSKHKNDGVRHFNMDEPYTLASLAKLERVLQKNTMPPAPYTAVHWGSTLSPVEKQALNQWIKDERKQKFGVDAVIVPIPDSVAVNQAKVALGYTLYHDVRLSSDNTVSCATCHAIDKAGTDNLARSKGVDKDGKPQYGGINAPTVFNAVFHTKQFWNGRAKDLKEQAGGPPLNPVEMGYSQPDDWKKIAAKLDADPQLSADFKRVYPQGFNGDTITDAIAEYEKTLITPHSPFDKFLKGDKKAISEKARKGYALFMELGCQTCHAGPAMGGQSFEYANLKGDFFGGRELSADDMGLQGFTQKEADKHKFRVPTLRNVELTWPYMHDASANTLEEAITKMFHYQLGYDKLNRHEIDLLVEFLKTLTGEYRGQRLKGTPCPTK